MARPKHIVLFLGMAWIAMGIPAGRSTAADNPQISDKTLVAWVAPANLTQRGGSALTIEKGGGVFDAVVLGELAPAKWMAGSEGFNRTCQDQSAWPAEDASAATTVQVAIVYQGNQVRIYRNGICYTEYDAGGAQRFGKDTFVVMGLRHLGAGPENRFFTGTIEDARIYDVALTADQIQLLQPNVASEPAPVAWWDFQQGNASDRLQRFPVTTLVGAARIDGGKLVLDQPGAYLMAHDEAPDTNPASADVNVVDQTARQLREKLLSDPYRAGYHFVVPEGRAMPFDPNGAIFWKGRYHLFYIFQDHRGHNWGHVSSTDLLHWRHHPTGLVSGMFSGNCFVNKDGRPTICYHQVGQGNAMAVAVDDELNQWEKLPSNPITPPTEPGDPHHDKYRSWDPYGWLEDNTYYAIFGGERPAIAKSDRLEGKWEYVGDLFAHAVDGASLNEDVSCADFFQLGDQRMLLCISHRLGCRYYLGQWKDEQFHPTYHAMMSWTDNSFFAPESLLDDRGRRIMWAWIFDGPAFATRSDFGWSGTMSLPRVLWLGEDGMLRMSPPDEMSLLRYHARRHSDLAVPADGQRTVEDVQGNSLELALEIYAPRAQRYGIKICCSPDDAEQTLIYYDAVEKKLTVDTTQSSLNEEPKSVEAGPLTLGPDEPLKLRVFVDKSVVEVFANDRQAVMRRVYPSRPDSLGVKLFATGGEARVVDLQAWDMMPANPY